MKKKIIILVSGLVIILAAGYLIDKKFIQDQTPPSPRPTALSPSSSISVEPSPTPSPSPSFQTTTLPNSYLIDGFPFQPQAPFANWDETHDEACEEAAIILVKWWHDNKATINAETMDDEILKMVAWQEKTWGLHKDLTIKETANLAESFYNLSLVARYDVDIEDIKKEVAQDHPVIVPTAGRLLGNPYYRQPGPIYHMLVIIGYEGNKIIVQDIGTKRGDHYKYNQQVLYNAIHDWAGSPDNISQGQKAMLVL